MPVIARLLVGLSGIISVLVTLSAWLKPADLATQLQLAITGPVGEAAVRADIGGIFASIGLFALYAAWKQSRVAATFALVAVCAAFAGRVAGLILSGAGEGTLMPMGVELSTIAILLFARMAWQKQPEGL